MGEHAVGKLAHKLEQARPVRRGRQRRTRADRRPAIEKDRRERLKLGPQNVLATLRKIEAGRDGRRDAELGGTAIVRDLQVPRQRGTDGRIVPDSQAGEIAHAPEIVLQNVKSDQHPRRLPRTAQPCRTVQIQPAPVRPTIFANDDRGDARTKSAQISPRS